MPEQTETKQTVKRTVVIHPLMDTYIRKTWAILIEAGFEATYSSALNFMLLAAVMEAIKDGGLTEEARNATWEFAQDSMTIEHLNLQDHLTRLRELWGENRLRKGSEHRNRWHGSAGSASTPKGVRNGRASKSSAVREGQ